MDDLYKMRYFGIAIDYYNKYSQRTLKIEINKVLIFSQILSKSREDRNTLLSSIPSTFDDKDKLKSIAELSKHLPDKEPILVKQSSAEKIIFIGGFIAAIIPVVITILQLMLSQYFPKSE
jgi:hypothetical protein